MEFDLEQVPSWAFNWCYYFAAVGFASVVMGFMGLFLGKKTSVGLTLVFLVGTLVQAATALTLFWMCRSSLRSGKSTCSK
jgi:hypothetical protein